MENGENQSINQSISSSVSLASRKARAMGHASRLGGSTFLQLFPTLSIDISLSMQISLSCTVHCFRSFWKWVGGPWESRVALFPPCNPCPLLGLMWLCVLCCTYLQELDLGKCCPSFAGPPSAATSCSFSRWLHILFQSGCWCWSSLSSRILQPVKSSYAHKNLK